MSKQFRAKVNSRSNTNVNVSIFDRVNGDTYVKNGDLTFTPKGWQNFRAMLIVNPRIIEIIDVVKP